MEDTTKAQEEAEIVDSIEKTEETSKEISPIVSVEDFSIRIGKNKTSFGSFKIYPGDFILLKGRNGSGKSTLLKHINCGFIYAGHTSSTLFYSKVTGGCIRLNIRGEDIESTNPEISTEDIHKIRTDVVDIRQDDSVEGWVSAYAALYDTTAVAIANDKRYKKEEKKKLIGDLKKTIQMFFDGYKLPNGDEFSLRKVLRCNPFFFRMKSLKRYSGGQQKMVSVLAGFIKAYITNTDLMLIDEPVNNLDGKNKYYLNELLKSLRSKVPNLAILMISHCNVFANINVVIDVINKDQSIDQYTAKITRKEDSPDGLIFQPHSECIEMCEILRQDNTINKKEEEKWEEN